MSDTTSTHTKYVAQPGVASSPASEMLGAVLLAFLQNANAEDIAPFLEKYQMEQIKPDQWYAEQLILDFEGDILNARVNSIDNLVAIGVKGIDTTPFPPEVKTFEDAVTALNTMAKHVSRNMPDEARIYIAKPGAEGPLVAANLPYPKDLLYGYVWALARRYKPAGKQFIVEYIENPDPENSPGHAFKVSWR